MKSTNSIRFAFVFASALTLSACPKHVPPPEAVIATGDSTQASPDGGTCMPVSGAVSTEIGKPPTIHGGCSVDHSGHGLEYTWAVVDHPVGSIANIVETHAISPTFAPDIAGDYKLSLVVSDGVLASAPAFVTITTSVCGGQAPVIAGVTASQNSVHTGTGVDLTVSASDADMTSPCTVGDMLVYEWHWVAVPAGSAATLNATMGTTASFVADVNGTYVAEVVVTDRAGHVASSQVTVTADACGLGTPTAVAQKTAPGTTVTCGPTSIPVNLNGQTNEIQLDGSLSTDPDNGAACGLNQNLFYQWTLMKEPIQTPGGNNSGATLRSLDGQTTILRVRNDGEHQVRLIVTDSTGRQSLATTCILNVSNVP